jgi:hypothetical protein
MDIYGYITSYNCQRHSNEGLIFPLQKLTLLLTNLTSFVANSGANFEYDLKSTIALLTPRELGLMVRTAYLIFPVENYGSSFSKIHFNPTVTHKNAS